MTTNGLDHAPPVYLLSRVAFPNTPSLLGPRCLVLTTRTLAHLTAATETVSSRMKNRNNSPGTQATAHLAKRSIQTSQKSPVSLTQVQATLSNGPDHLRLGIGAARDHTHLKRALGATQTGRTLLMHQIIAQRTESEMESTRILIITPTPLSPPVLPTAFLRFTNTSFHPSASPWRSLTMYPTAKFTRCSSRASMTTSLGARSRAQPKVQLVPQLLSLGTSSAPCLEAHQQLAERHRWPCRDGIILSTYILPQTICRILIRNTLVLSCLILLPHPFFFLSPFSFFHYLSVFLGSFPP